MNSKYKTILKIIALVVLSSMLFSTCVFAQEPGYDSGIDEEYDATYDDLFENDLVGSDSEQETDVNVEEQTGIDVSNKNDKIDAGVSVIPSENNAYVVMSNEVRRNHIHYVDGYEEGIIDQENPGYCEPFEMDGVLGRRVYKTNYLDFVVDKDYYQPGDSKFMVMITFYDFGPSEGYFHFDYANTKGDKSRVSVLKPGVVPKWRTTKFVIENADFTRLVDEKYNFRLVSNLYNAFAKVELVNISVAERSDTYMDLGSANSIQAEALDTLNVMKGENGAPATMGLDKKLTRGELIKMLVKAFTKEDEALGENNKCSFSDVSSDLAPYVAYGEKIGMIQGSGGGKFNPDELATPRQMLTFMMRYLGIEDDNLYENSWKMGNDMGFVDGMNLVLYPDGPLSRDSYAAILYNGSMIKSKTSGNTILLDNVLEGVFTEDDAMSTGVKEIMAYRFMAPRKIEKKTFVDSTSGRTYNYMDFDGLNAIRTYFHAQSWNEEETKFLIANKSFMGAKDLLGKNVEFFFTKDKKELIYAQPFNNTIIQIDADDLVPGSTTINNISYYTESGKQKNESLMLTTKMIYNGFQYPYYTADDIKITDGTVTLIDNDNDGAFEVVCVDEYVDYEVTGATDKAIVTTDKAIEYEQYKNVYFYDENGNSITYDKVASGSTATVYESKDKNMLSIYFISNSINGVLNKVAQDESGITTYQIGEKYYELTTSLENKIEAGKVLPLDIGTGYVCKLNIFGEIVSFEKIETSDWKDAYCVGLAHPNKSGIDSKVQANLVMVGGSVFKPYLSNKILFNGESKKATELVGSSYFEDVSGTPLRQPVKVKINNNGEITAMQVPEDKTMTTYGVDFGVFSYDKYLASGHYRGNNNYKTINNHVLTSKTIIVEDPHYKVDGAEGETEGVVFYTMDLFPIEVTLNDIRFYDLDEGLRPGVMVYKSKNITIQGTPFLVDSVISVLNEEGDKIKRITGYSNGAFLTYDEIEQGIIPANIKRGDVCKIALDGTKLAVIERVMSLKDRKPYADTTVINAKTCYVYSYLYSVTDTSLVVTAPESYTDSKLIGSSIGAAKIIVYDLTADKMYLGTTKDLYTDFVPDSQGEYSVTDDSTMVFIHRSYDRAGDIIVVKK